jgi:hypothetical protein
MFVSKYAPAHKFNRVAAFWQSPVIPNRPHLTDEANNNQRYDILHIGTVESAHLVVPDLGRSSYYWAVIHADTCLWHEAYADDGEGEEGEYALLNPGAFSKEGDTFSCKIPSKLLMHIQALDFRMQLQASRDGSFLAQHQQDRDAESDETEVEREFRDELQSQVSQLMNGALL